MNIFKLLKVFKIIIPPLFPPHLCGANTFKRLKNKIKN